MLESTHEHSYMNSGTISLTALLQGKLDQNSVRNSLSPTQQLVDQNNTLICHANGFLCGQHGICCGIFFSCFLFIKFIVDLIVMILRLMEIHRLTAAPLGFGMTILSASYNLYLASILTSVFNSQAPRLQALEPEPTTTRIEEAIRDPVDENKKKEEHLYPIVHHLTRALSPV